MMAKKLTVKDVGPIRELTVPVPEDGGVVVVRGRNGSGKSTLLRAAQGLLGDKKDKTGLRHNDDAERGSVSLGECTLTVGRSNRSSGVLDVHTIAGHVDLGDIVDPQVDDPVRADKRRIEAVFKVAGSNMSGRELVKLLGDEINDVSAPASKWDEPILDVADFLRDVFVQRARMTEADVKKLSIDVAANKKSVPEEFEEATLEQVEAAKQAFIKASEEGIKLKERQRIGRETEARVQEAKKSIAELEQQGLRASTIEEIDDAIRAQINVVNKATQALEDARETLRKENNTLEQMEHERKETLKFIETRNKLSEVLQSSIEVIKEEQIEEATKAVTAAQERFDALRQSVAYAQIRDSTKELEKQVEEKEKLAKKYRELSTKGIDSALGQLIGTVFHGSQFLDGRLAVEHPTRGTTYFGELSDGERWTIVLNLATSLCPESTVLVVPQTAWEGLDGDNRIKINDWAKEHKIVVLTAEATRDPGEEGIHAAVLN